MARRLRPRRTVGLLAAALSTLTACMQTVDGAAWKALPPLVVEAPTVSKIVGSQLPNVTDDLQPPPPIAVDRPQCALAAGPSTRAVYTDGWTQFHLVTMQEAADYWDHSVTQTVGRYPDAASAKKILDSLIAGLNECTQEPVVSTDALDDSQSSWQFRVDDSGADRVAWSATQRDADNWACYRDARLAGPWVLQVAVCQAGNGRPAAATIIDKLAANVKQ